MIKRVSKVPERTQTIIASRLGKLPESPLSSPTAFNSSDTEAKVLRELKIAEARLRAETARDIAVQINEYRIRVINDAHHISDASEIARAKRAIKALKDARLAVEQLGRDAVLGYLIPALSGDLDHPRTREGFSEDLFAVVKRLEDFLKSTNPKPGREPLDALDDFVTELAAIYEGATGRAPGYSSKPSSKPNSRAKTTHGPFVRFCQDVVSVVTPKAVGAVFDSVRRVLRRKRPESRGKNWP